MKNIATKISYLPLALGIACLPTLLNAGDLKVEGKLHVTEDPTVSAPNAELYVGSNDPAEAVNAVVFEGTFGLGTVPSMDSGQPKFMWSPGKAALRAGLFFGTQMGDYSIAIGNANEASDYAAAFGDTNMAGPYSLAAGDGNVSEEYGIAVGRDNYAGTGSAAFGNYSYVTGAGSIATGIESAALGDYSAAFGNVAYAIGNSSLAAGHGWAQGEYSTAFGNASAMANHSTAFGATYAYHFAEFVIGRNNSASWEDSSDYWNPLDRLFTIGNGTGNSQDPQEVSNRNAFIVFKNGAVKILAAPTLADGTTPEERALVTASNADKSQSFTIDHNAYVTKIRVGQDPENDGTYIGLGDLSMGQFTD